MTGFDLAAHLEQRGLADTDGVRRTARYSRCPRCHTGVLIGLDADVAGLPRTVDITDLDRIAELLVLASGRTTLRVLQIADRIQLADRPPLVIAAEQQDRPVVAVHVCGAVTPPSTASRWRMPLSATTDQECPF